MRSGDREMATLSLITCCRQSYGGVGALRAARRPLLPPRRCPQRVVAFSLTPLLQKLGLRSVLPEAVGAEKRKVALNRCAGWEGG